MQYTAYRENPFASFLTPWVKRLLLANVVAFFLTSIIGQEAVFRWFAFAPSEILTRPWGAITYMFLHGGLWHLLVNMLVLFFFGPHLERRWGSREFLKYYFICGLGGVALSFVFVPYWIVGASAAMYGLMLAFAMNWPNVPIYVWGIFPVKAKWLVGFLFLVSLLSAVGGSNSGVAHFAHLGGILAGFAYLKSDWGPGKSSRSTGRSRGVRIRRMAIVPREDKPDEAVQEGSGAKPWSSEDERVLDEVDRILDKISAEGMSSLTSRERKVLDEVSKKHRSN